MGRYGAVGIMKLRPVSRFFDVKMIREEEGRMRFVIEAGGA